MKPWVAQSILMATVVMAGSIGPGVAPAIAAPEYTVLAAQSSLTFIGSQQGEKFTGTVRDYDAKIAFAPEDLPGSKLDVVIRVKSIDTRSPDRDQALATADWFDFAKFPVATFRTTAIRAGATGPVGEAQLMIKGHTKAIPFPFVWKATPGGATLDARATLDRIDFGLGTGDWADDAMVGRKVEVVVHLTLVAAPAPAAAVPAAAAKAAKH